MQQTAPSSMPHTAGFAHPPRVVAMLQIEHGMSAADFGCGSGHYVWPIAEALGEHGTLFAIDVQKDLLRRVHNEAQRRGLKNVKIIWADLEKPKASKIADRTLDMVLMSNVLFQLEDKHATLLEARRVLKPSGKLVVIDWSESSGGLGPHKNAVVTEQAARDLLQGSDFEVTDQFRAGTHHWGLLALPRT
jgi:ubiquinone/menaquinone biosynthesis C-methylase UbiE